jgi:S-DNA-T family DNA segregation ATPase FtsK/SpoIIIE
MARYSKVVKSKKKQKNGFLPETAHVFLARRIIDVAGLVFFVFGAAILLSIASYHHTDPSANTASAASDAEIGNWLGAPGAYIADFLLQTIGLGGAVFGIVFATWGFRIYKRQSLSPLWLRVVALVISALAASVAAARISSGGWLLAPYMGGSGGILILQSLTRFTPEILSLSPYTLVACITGIISLCALFFALAIRKEEYHALKNLAAHVSYTIVDTAITAAQSFIEWVRHYGDPDYELPRSAAKADRAAKRAEKKREKAAAKEAKKAEKSAAPQSPPVRKEPALTAPVQNKDTASAPEKERVAPPVSSNINVVKPKTEAAQKKIRQTTFALEDNGEWELPTIDLLEEPPEEDTSQQLDENALRQNAELLKNVLADFNIEGEITSIHPGPVVTLYELEPAPGTKTSRVIGLSDDIARSMSAISVRCSVIPGRSVIGIEIPNARRQTVHFYDMLTQTDISKTKAKLPLILGKDIGGSSVIADLAKMPHLLVAGTTGAGKSVAINTMILSLLYHLSPEKCRLIMIDPKMLELSVYDNIPHLLSPVVTEPGKAVVSLKWAVQEMEERYRAMSKLGVRNIDGYNQRLREARKKGETIMRKVQTGFDTETGKPVYEEQPLDLTELPYIVIVVDEFADLMLVAGKDVENAIQRLAQMARAAGLHLIMATQRPSVDVITGIIKANFPTRISFQVTSKVDSRTILNEGGAEQLLGMGDMLFMPSGGQLQRVHGPFVTDDDVESVVSFLKKQGEPAYIDDVTEGGDFGDSDVMNAMFGGSGGNSDVDELYDKAVAIVARERKASTSFIQRHLQIGYNRAARIIEEMEKQGVVTPATSTGKRDVLVSDFSDA